MEFWRCASLVWACSRLRTPLPLKVPPINTTYINSSPNLYQENKNKTSCCPKSDTKKLPTAPTVSGYFMGAASWSQSFDALSHNNNGGVARDVYAIDWPSWGLSGREDFPSQQPTDVCYLESDFLFFWGWGNHETRYKALVIAVDLYCLCCLYQLLLLHRKFQCFF